MLCLKAEELCGEMYPSHGALLPVNLGSSIQRAIPRGRKVGHRASDLSSSSSRVDGFSLFKENENSISPERDFNVKMWCYRSQLEREVQILQKQLEDEIDLHAALSNAVENNTLPLSRFPSKLPNEAQELLDSIDSLEVVVAKLEEELFALQFCLHHERSERYCTESLLKHISMPSLEAPLLTSGYMWEEHVTSLRVSKLGGHVPSSLHYDILPGSGDLESVIRPAEISPINEALNMSSGEENEKQTYTPLEETFTELDNINVESLWKHPNHLSEEMLLCMRNIFLCLSGSLVLSARTSLSDSLSSASSPVGHLSHSSLTSFSDSFRLPSLMRGSSEELIHSFEACCQEKLYDPYGVNRRVNWKDIGKYSFATNISWMTVGKMQLEYAAKELKKFRLLVEQLAKVNPTQMSRDEKLAFWINIYNALIMHAYLAYGVPRSDVKHFSLMQKACYTVGGQCFSAVDIEFVILKMKPPVHRQKMALILALHKFKMLEEHKKFSIDCSEPLALFALSCGMYSCPAVRIFTADNVQAELQKSMKDYIQASVGINDKGELLVPQLLYCFAKGVVEDSLLVDWICKHLNPEQAAVVQGLTSQRKRLLGVRSFTVIPFDSGFRYLFMPITRIVSELKQSSMLEEHCG